MSRYTSGAIITILLCTLPFYSCKDDMAFEAENKTTIDTMFYRKNALIRMEIDSLCVSRNQAVYQAAFDSILDVRIAQIKSRLSEAQKAAQ